MNISYIKSLIIQGELKKAFQLVSTQENNIPQKAWSEFLLIYHQFNRIEKERLLNFTSGTEELNRTIYAFVKWLANLESGNEAEINNALPEQSSPEVIALNEAKLIYELNQNLFQYFKGVNTQIEQVLEQANLPREFPNELREKLHILNELKTEIDTLSIIRTEDAGAYIDKGLEQKIQTAITYIKEEMNWVEVAAQRQKLQHFQFTLKQQQQRQQFPIYFIIGLVIAFAALLIMMVVWLSTSN